jgi:hypothetical protein
MEKRAVAKNWRRRPGCMPERAGARLVTMAAAATSALDRPLALRVPKPQETVVAVFRSLYPGGTFERFKFPMIEDLVNKAPFTAYTEWREEKGLAWEGPMGPAIASQRDTSWARNSMGKAAGSYLAQGGVAAARSLPAAARRTLSRRL